MCNERDIGFSGFIPIYAICIGTSVSISKSYEHLRKNTAFSLSQFHVKYIVIIRDIGKYALDNQSIFNEFLLQLLARGKGCCPLHFCWTQTSCDHNLLRGRIKNDKLKKLDLERQNASKVVEYYGSECNPITSTTALLAFTECFHYTQLTFAKIPTRIRFGQTVATYQRILQKSSSLQILTVTDAIIK